YVIYQIGLCNFERIDTVDRDQTTARKALESFQRLKKSYPNDPETQKAEANIFKCNSSMAGHEFYVGLFYFKSKHYKAALSRFKTVLTEYPDVGIHKEAMEYIARCEAKLPDTPADPALTMQGGNKEGMNGIQ
ncbi:MAG: outer membrane protein assembly factor BamD, partial [Desulfobacterales bacterium]|nr:outer membrane protein assembly factor BamD [Desulfobacterales bacterium]